MFILTKHDNLEIVVFVTLETSVCLEDGLLVGAFLIFSSDFLLFHVSIRLFGRLGESYGLFIWKLFTIVTFPNSVTTATTEFII